MEDVTKESKIWGWFTLHLVCDARSPLKVNDQLTIVVTDDEMEGSDFDVLIYGKKLCSARYWKGYFSKSGIDTASEKHAWEKVLNDMETYMNDWQGGRTIGQVTEILNREQATQAYLNGESDPFKPKPISIPSITTVQQEVNSEMGTWTGWIIMGIVLVMILFGWVVVEMLMLIKP